MPNENVLQGISCPACASEGPFDIDAQTTFLRVDDDGHTETMGMDWEDTSTFRCCSCDHTGTAYAFAINTRYQAGDEVYWTDPDAGAASRTYRISTIRYLSNGVVRIMEDDGSVLECFRGELT